MWLSKRSSSDSRKSKWSNIKESLNFQNLKTQRCKGRITLAWGQSFHVRTQTAIFVNRNKPDFPHEVFTLRVW